MQRAHRGLSPLAATGSRLCSAVQPDCAWAQRARKRHPLGMRAGVGTRPGMALKRLPGVDSRGSERSSPEV
jgi:hypothetical protein